MFKRSSGCKLIFYGLIFLMNSALKFQYLISMRIFNWYPLTLQRIPTLRWTATQASACGILNCFTRSPASSDAMLLSPSLSLPCLLLLFSFASTENLLPSLILSCASFHHLLFHTLAAANAAWIDVLLVPTSYLLHRYTFLLLFSPAGGTTVSPSCRESWPRRRKAMHRRKRLNSKTRYRWAFLSPLFALA